MVLPAPSVYRMHHLRISPYTWLYFTLAKLLILGGELYPHQIKVKFGMEEPAYGRGGVNFWLSFDSSILIFTPIRMSPLRVKQSQNGLRVI